MALCLSSLKLPTFSRAHTYCTHCTIALFNIRLSPLILLNKGGGLVVHIEAIIRLIVDTTRLITVL